LLAQELNALQPTLQIKTKPTSHTIKLQCNEGNGGCFPLHYDNPGMPDKRRLSCLLYLNPNYTVTSGGQLRVIPFLQAATDILPIFDRLVIFYSETILHRVLPAYNERFCLTIWLDSDIANQEQYAPIWTGSKLSDLKLDNQTYQYLQQPTVQRVLSRAIYEEEYELSIKECMNGAEEGKQKLLASHTKYIQSMRQNKTMADIIDQLKNMKQQIISNSIDNN